MSKLTFSINIEGYWELTVAEMWPDGDAPENPTREDAIARIKDEISAIGFHRFMSDWNLEDDLRIDVENTTVYPAWMART